MKSSPVSNHDIPVLQQGSEAAFLARSLAIGDAHVDCARVYLALQSIAESKGDFFRDVISGALIGNQLIKEIITQDLSPKTVAAVLYTIFKKECQEIQSILNSDILKIKFPRVAGSIVDAGVKEVCLTCGITRKVELHAIWDYPQQQRCFEFVRKLQEWVANPLGRKIPNDVFELPIACLVRIIPWLDGRQDQLRDIFKALTLDQADLFSIQVKSDLSKTSSYKSSASSSPVFAWAEVNPIGAIVLNISVKDKDFKSENHNPILARYMIGAVTTNSGGNTSPSEYTRGSLLLSRAESNVRMKELYPAMPKNQRAYQESLNMAVGGSVELNDFEGPRHLKVAQQTFATVKGAKLSRTATLTIISSLFLSVPERGAEIKGEKIKKVVRRCRATVGLPSALTLDRDIDTCHIRLSRETTHQVARTGEFVGSRFALYGVSAGQKVIIGSLYFKSRHIGKIPRFELEPIENNLNHKQIAKWRQVALNWLTTTGGSKPTGYVTVPIISNPNDQNQYFQFRNKKITLSALPKTLKNLIAYPAKIKFEGDDKKALLLFSEHGKVEAAIYCSDDAGGKTIQAVTAYMPRYVKKGIFTTYWNEVVKKGAEIWAEHLDTAARLKRGND